MLALQPIVCDERLVAVVIAQQAIIDESVSEGELRFVQAMALYALEVAERKHPGPYSDQAAQRYARDALAQRAQ